MIYQRTDAYIGYLV